LEHRERHLEHEHRQLREKVKRRAAGRHFLWKGGYASSLSPSEQNVELSHPFPFLKSQDIMRGSARQIGASRL
jgi:hypothetical protein